MSLALWIVVLTADPAGHVTPRDALLVCYPDHAGQAVCEATLRPSDAVGLAECLVAGVYTHEEAEESSSVLGCSPDGRVLVIDPETLEWL